MSYLFWQHRWTLKGSLAGMQSFELDFYFKVYTDGLPLRPSDKGKESIALPIFFWPGVSGLKLTLFCSRHWLCSLSCSRRAADAHCDASLRMRLFMKLSDSFPVPTCSSRPPMSDWKTACATNKRVQTDWSCSKFWI